MTGGAHGVRLGRRRLLETVGGGTAVSLGGCVGIGTDGGENDDSGVDDGNHDHAGDNDDTERDHEDEFAPHEGDALAEFPPDHVCNGICGMAVTDYPTWNAQLAHANGMGAFFCTPGCMIAYLQAPAHVGAIDADVVGAWTTEFETGVMIDAASAFYVLEDDVDRMDEPMGVNPRPFADREDAIAHVEGQPDHTEEDIIRLEEFDLELARTYRGHGLPDGIESGSALTVESND